MIVRVDEKYTFYTLDNDWRIFVKRYGEEWLIIEQGHKAILAMMHELEESRLDLNLTHDRLIPLAKLIDHAGFAIESPCSACRGTSDPREPDITCAWCGGLGARLVHRESP